MQSRPETIRLFTAIELNDAARQQLVCASHWFEARVAAGRFMPPENLHLTLNFLGETAADRISDIQAALAAAASGCQPFSLELGEPGCFPRGHNTLLWMGLKQMPQELVKLYHASEKALAAIGFPAEKRRYSPHLTFARSVSFSRPFWELKAEYLRELAAGKDLQAPERQTWPAAAVWPVAELVLFLSSRLCGCQIYTPLFRAKLGDIV
ncbi:MAG: RNA 2',3'-cyclic phosphodiesterase [Spirochaetes bacterium]|nr:RNA 2',3'-cyclic phosphodiesterase [Spirochaetota bacterium]MBU0955107.1 RNA 2',3'-cyclic phosphodiesterase [Spirochaetota bacterium]